MNVLKCSTAAALLSLLAFGAATASPVVHPGDALSVDVLNYDAVIDDSGGRLKNLATESVVVAADGSVSLPVAGTFKVAGEDTQQIGHTIQARLAAYVRDPAVTVRLLQQSQLIFLTGATIGTLPFLPGETLSSALGQLREQQDKDVGQVLTPSDKYANSLARSSIDYHRIVVERDRHVGRPIDGEALLSSGRPGPALAPGDTLLLASKPVHVNVRGQVVSPGTVYLYHTDTLEQAVLAAGGALPTASTADVSLISKRQRHTAAAGRRGVAASARERRRDRGARGPAHHGGRASADARRVHTQERLDALERIVCGRRPHQVGERS